MTYFGTDSSFEPDQFRRVLGTFTTGVTVVTTIDQLGKPYGLTANSFTSVSLDPPLILVCLDHRSTSLAALRDSQVFAVNILSEGQRDLSNRFASRADDKFAGISCTVGRTGAPILPGSIGWLDCESYQVVSAGDHDVVIGRVVALSETSDRPLGYFRGGFIRVSLEQDATGHSGQTVFGAIIEHQSGVLLSRCGVKSPWSFPATPARSRDLVLGGLREMLAEAGAPTELNFLYSVAEIPKSGCTSILYRGELRGEPDLRSPENWQFFAEEVVPWGSLASYETEMTLRRYFRERQLDRFGLFADTGDSGRIALIEKRLRPYSRDDAERDLR